MKSVKYLLLCIFLIALINCSDKPPEIIEIFWQVNLFQNREIDKIYQKLSLFINVDDPDGFDDIEMLYLINDENELFWSLESEEWYKSTSGTQTWIGTNGFSMPDHSPFPGGKYRILLQDMGGQTDEKEIYLSKTKYDPAKITFPLPKIEEQTITITGDFPNPEILVYDDSKRFINNHAVNKEGLTIQQITSGRSQLANSFMYYVFAFDNKNDMGLMSGPYFYSKTTTE